MARSQSHDILHRRSAVGDRSTSKAASPPDAEHQNTPGHPNVRGTLPVAHYLTDPIIKAEIHALARTSPRMTVDQAVRIARLLRWNEPRILVMPV